MAWICNMYIQTTYIYTYAYLYMFKSMKPYFVDMPAFFPPGTTAGLQRFACHRFVAQQRLERLSRGVGKPKSSQGS